MGRTTSIALIEDELRQDFPNEQVCFSFVNIVFCYALKIN